MEDRQYRTAQDLDRGELEQAIDEIWTDLQTNPAAQQEAQSLGIDVGAIRDLPRDSALEVRKRAAGFGAEAIIIAFLPLGVKIAGDVWEKIILPRLLQRFGRDALKEEQKTS